MKYKIFLTFAVLVVLIIAGVFHFFPEYNPFITSSSALPELSDDDKEKPQEKSKIETTEVLPPEKPKIERSEVLPLEVIEKVNRVKSLMLNSTYLTDEELIPYNEITGASSIDEETMRPLINKHFGGWNQYHSENLRALVKFGCTLLKLYAKTPDVELSKKYLDIVTKMIGLIETDFLKHYEVKRTGIDDPVVCKTIKQLGKLFNMYQYVVNTESINRDYKATKLKCKKYLNKLVPKLNFANGSSQKMKNIVYVSVPLLLSLYIMDYKSYQKKIANEQTEFEVFKDNVDYFVKPENRHHLHGFDYYNEIFTAFNFWK